MKQISRDEFIVIVQAGEILLEAELLCEGEYDRVVYSKPRKFPMGLDAKILREAVETLVQYLKDSGYKVEME